MISRDPSTEHSLETVATNTLWVVIAAVLVLFMQAASPVSRCAPIAHEDAQNRHRQDHDQHVDRDIYGRSALRSRSVAPTCSIGSIISSTGSSCSTRATGPRRSPSWVYSTPVESKFLFQFAFCAVSLAIVWGTTLERIKYSVYVVCAIVFAAIIYPIGSALGVRRRVRYGSR